MLVLKTKSKPIKIAPAIINKLMNFWRGKTIAVPPIFPESFK